MNKIPAALAAALILLLSGFVSAGWRIDAPARFQFAYVPDGKNAPGGKTEAVAPLGLTSDSMPDIDNIGLAGIKSLGFTLPDRPSPEKYKLYLKLFNFPLQLDARAMSLLVLRNYHMDSMPGGGELLAYASQNKNLAVKYGHIDLAARQFSPSEPFPEFRVTRGQGYASGFIKNSLFFSLYLTPDKPGTAVTEDELARQSAQGVLDFHKALVAHYNRMLKVIEGPQPDKYYYYRDVSPKVTIRVPKEPMLFPNWRDLPMPTNPKRHFLSGLLLVYRSQEKVTSMAQETVFEVGSIVRLTDLPASTNMSVSSVFADGAMIPASFTCDGEKKSLPLSVAGVPSSAKSLAFSVVDPDAPSGNWVHWLAWNIAPGVSQLDRHALAEGAVEGYGSGGVKGYYPPCPPSGSHRYVITVYALDTMISLPEKVGLGAFNAAVKGHIVGQASLTGRYR